MVFIQLASGYPQGTVEDCPQRSLFNCRVNLAPDGSFDTRTVGATGLKFAVQPCPDGDQTHLWVFLYPERHLDIVASIADVTVAIGTQRVIIGQMPDNPWIQQKFIGEEWPAVWGFLPEWQGDTQVRFERTQPHGQLLVA